MNKHVIKLIKAKQVAYKLIYSSKLIELETVKLYIEINQLFKSFIINIFFSIKNQIEVFIFILIIKN